MLRFKSGPFIFPSRLTLCVFMAGVVVLSTITRVPTAMGQNWTDQVFPVPSHDFGSVAVASKTEFYFPVYNSLGSQMHISSVRSSCGCTSPSVMNEYIEPGETGFILAKFNTGSFRGSKSATVTVAIDRPFYGEARLKVSGYIRSDMVFHPGSVEFGAIDFGSSATKTVQVLYAGRQDWSLLEVRSNRPWITPTFVETTRNSGRVNYDLVVSLSPEAPEGYFQDELTVVTNDRNMPRVPLRISGKIERGVEVTPGSLVLGTVVAGTPVRKKLVVVAKSPLQVLSMTAEGWDIQLDENQESKTTHVLEPSFTYTGTQTGEIRADISIVTSGTSGKSVLIANVEEAAADSAP
jgi:Protein of unknown function (DUF1573)